jgi:hypothetical protein
MERESQVVPRSEAQGKSRCCAERRRVEVVEHLLLRSRLSLALGRLSHSRFPLFLSIFYYNVTD